MTTRSLTEVFILMRNNAIRNRNLYTDQDNSERMSLISLNDIERGTGSSSEAPIWVNQLDKIHSIMSKLEIKINELNDLHLRHLHRPTLDESSEEELLIERLTTDISMMFSSAHRIIQHISNHSFEGNVKERTLTGNVVKSLYTKLQELSTMFRGIQSSYLKQINSREERSKLYFDDPVLKNDYDVFENEDAIDNYFVKNNQITQQQLLYLEEENSKVAVQREQEVNHIVKSIIDLNDIFKDLARMVTDQGTVLDRIDYNIEQTQTQVYEGLKQLQKADTYQKKNRKMCCILILAATIVLLIILLIIFKQ